MYEITFIAKEENESVVKTLIENLGGKVVKEENLGRKKLAYPIKKERAGFYVTYYFSIDGEKLAGLEKKLNLKKEIIRFLIIKSEKDLNKIAKKLPEKEVTEMETAETQETTPELAKEKEDIKEVEESAKKTDKVEKEAVQKPKKVKKVVKVKKLKKEETPTKETVETKEKSPAKEEPKKEVAEKERLKQLEEKLDELLKD